MTDFSWKTWHKPCTIYNYLQQTMRALRINRVVSAKWQSRQHHTPIPQKCWETSRNCQKQLWQNCGRLPKVYSNQVNSEARKRQGKNGRKALPLSLWAPLEDCRLPSPVGTWRWLWGKERICKSLCTCVWSCLWLPAGRSQSLCFS